MGMHTSAAIPTLYIALFRLRNQTDSEKYFCLLTLTIGSRARNALD